MNNFIKHIIEEEFASKAQQRFFYAKAKEKDAPKKEKKKWSKWANEFSSKTDFEKIPEKVDKEKKDPNQTELEFNEIVDDKGNIQRSKKPTNLTSKGITQDKTSDETAKMATGQMGSYGGSGAQPYRRYWGESDMSKSLGFDDTMGKDATMDDAEDHFEKNLGMDDSDTEERLSQMGYDKSLPKDKVRLVENPKKFVEEYIESLIQKKTLNNDIVSDDKKELNPIIKKQINSLKQTMDSNNLTVDDVVKYLKNNE
jgi:hypothetical protein